MLTTKPSSQLLQSQVIEKLLDAKQHKRLNSDTRGWILKGFVSGPQLTLRLSSTDSFGNSKLYDITWLSVDDSETDHVALAIF